MQKSGQMFWQSMQPMQFPSCSTSTGRQPILLTVSDQRKTGTGQIWMQKAHSLHISLATTTENACLGARSVRLLSGLNSGN